MKARLITSLILGFVLCAWTAQAAVITGNLWKVPEVIAQDASLANFYANVAIATPDVTFDVNSPFSFWADGSNFPSPLLVSDWLSTGNAFNINEITPGTLASFIDDSSDWQTGTGSIVYFKGFVPVTNGQQITISHDDGVTLVIAGVDLGFYSGITGIWPETMTYTGPSGWQPFELVYGECCMGEAVLAVSVPLSNTVPEPGTMMLLGSGLLGLVSYGMKRMMK